LTHPRQKAGKVRQQTPKIEGRKKKKKNPRVRNKSLYKKRYLLRLSPGQVYPPEQRKERRGERSG